jgi:hypothetical protein
LYGNNNLDFREIDHLVVAMHTKLVPKNWNHGDSGRHPSQIQLSGFLVKFSPYQCHKQAVKLTYDDNIITSAMKK